MRGAITICLFMFVALPAFAQPTFHAGVGQQTQNSQSDAKSFFDRGITRRNRNDFDGAIDDFSSALKLQPELVDALIARGEAYFHKGNFEFAIRDYDVALEINPENARAFEGRGDVHDFTSDFDLAIADYDQAIHINPNDGNALNGRCWVSAEADKSLQVALADCDAAVALAPNASIDRLNRLDSRGFVFFRLGEFDKAIADDSAALALNSQWPSSLYIRGLAKRRKGDLANGDADISSSKMIDPSVAERFTQLGVIP